MDKTLGQVAFDAYVNWRIHYNNDLGHRERWEEAAKAVRQACPRCGKFSRSSGVISQDSMPPMLSEHFECEAGHTWYVGWGGA
jgi:hypothetical protein